MVALVLYSNPSQILVQAKAVIVTILFSSIATAIVWKISELITRGGRIREELELEGMDIGYHGEHHMVVEEEKSLIKFFTLKRHNIFSLPLYFFSPLHFYLLIFSFYHISR